MDAERATCTCREPWTDEETATCSRCGRILAGAQPAPRAEETPHALDVVWLAADRALRDRALERL